MDADTMFGVMLTAFLAIVVLCVKPLGSYIAAVMQLAGDKHGADKQRRPNAVMRAGARFETLVYRLCGIDAGEEMSWKHYAIALLVFNVLGAVVVYGLQRLQLWLPLNPQNFAGRESRLVIQHRDQLRHQYQLAGVLGRIDHELSDPDGRARRAEFPVGRHRASPWPSL